MNDFSCLRLTLSLLIIFKSHVGNSSPLRIVNGTDAKEGEFPYIVQLRQAGGFMICGGSIISSKWILTAGHCIPYTSTIHSIVYGTTKLYGKGDGYPNTSIYVEDAFLHPKYVLDKHGVPKYDIGLLQLKEPIPFDERVQPITLVQPGAEIPFHVNGSLAGWGSVTTSGPSSPTLQKIKLNLLTDDECIKRINKVVHEDSYAPEHHLCSDDFWNGICFGDSGGPFAVNNTQYGVVSWSYKPCGSHPGSYSRLSNPEYRNWIKKVAKV